MKTNAKKTKMPCLTVLILILLITACRKERKNPEIVDYESISVDTAVVEQASVINQDSIDRANALAQEVKERKIIDAENYISSFTDELKKKISPNSGRNPVYQILNSESTYNDLTGTLAVVFESRWEAIPDYNFNSTHQTHIYKGRLTLYGDGETRQEEISKNDVLIRAIEANEGMVKFNDFLNSINSNER
jgi:hypothetical protein